jgi:hypothetical protein
MNAFSIDRIRFTTLIFSATLLAILSCTLVMASTGERVIVSVETFATAGDAETKSSGSTELSLIEGESGAVYITSGSFDKNGGIGSLYNMGGAGQFGPEATPPFADLPQWNPTAWGIRCTLISRQQGEIKLQVEWERVEQEKPGMVTRRAANRRLITLPEEGRHILDVIGTTDGLPDAAGLINRTVELKVCVAEAPSLAKKRIQFDLWLVDESADDRKISRAIRLIGRQGERLGYRFETIRQHVPGIELDNGSAIETVMDIEGAIRGRIQPDGTIGITLDTERRFGLAAAGKDSRGWSSDGGGSKFFVMNPGEAVSTLLPEPVGQSLLKCHSGETPNPISNRSESNTPHQGVSVTDSSVRVQFEPFFEGHSISLILKAEPTP